MTRLASFWSGLGGDPALLSRVSAVERPGVLPSRLPVREFAGACVGVCALAAAELAARRTGGGVVPAVRVDDGAVATAFVSERHLRTDGRAAESFAPLSRFWRTADGWVRTHANYPHHRARLLTALGAPEDPDAVAAVLARRSAREVEETVTAAGGLAVALRTPEEWAAHGQAAAVARLPLVERVRLDAAPAREFTAAGGDPLLPAAGLRVLDLTRVIAGPVATRTLALLGADVLRLDPPGLPELPDQHTDTGFGKRSALVDLASGREVFEELLARADVVVTGYRPGSLDRFGLSAEALAGRRPGSSWHSCRRGAPPGRGRGGAASTAWSRWRRASPTSRESTAARRAARPGPGPRHGVPARGGGAAGPVGPGGRGWRQARAGGSGPHGGRGAGGGGRFRRPRRRGARHAVARGTEQPTGAVAVRPAPVDFEGGPRDWARPPGAWGRTRRGGSERHARLRHGGQSPHTVPHLPLLCVIL